MVSFLWVEGELLMEKKQGFLQFFNMIVNELEMEKSVEIENLQTWKYLFKIVKFSADCKPLEDKLVLLSKSVEKVKLMVCISNTEGRRKCLSVS